MATHSVTAKTIVIANDSAAVRDRFAAALESAGHRAIVARTASEVLERARSGGPALDLILLDLRLPDGDGTGIVRAIRGIEGATAPLLVFSGTVDGAQEVRELVRLGVAGYLNEHSAVQHIVPSIAPHLFPNSFNRRSGPRVSLAVSVEYRVDTGSATALTLNIGAGGLAIRTTTPLDRSSKVAMRFRIPGTPRDVEADGQVIWSDARVGMGIQFQTIEPALQAIVDTFVDAHDLTKRSREA